MRFFLNLLFPDTCVGCGSVGVLLCDKCPLSPSVTSEAVFSYTDPKIKKLIHLLKYKNGKRVASIFSPYITEAFNELLGEEGLFLGKRTIVVPIPLSKERMKERGFNQVELLGKGLPLDTSLLKKQKSTFSQARTASRNQRLTNLIGSFVCTRESKGESIILLDDVMTTGATISVAKEALRMKGFKDIRVLVLAT